MVDVRTETNTGILRQMAILLQRENGRLHERLKSLAEENDRLRGNGGSVSQLQLELSNLQELLAARERELFGRSSEKRASEKAGDNHSSGASSGSEKPAPKTGHGPKAQPRLPITVEIHALPEAERACSFCGGALAPMTGQYEESEEITVVRRAYIIVKHKREKYRCKCMENVTTAPSPEKLVPGGRYSVEFAAGVAASKYLDHMPLERQTRAMGRDGLNVDSQTLWDQVEALARHLKPSYEAVGRDVLGSPVIGADETHWPLVGRKGACRWWAWAAASERGAFYRILNSRPAMAAKEILGNYRGIVVADGYGAYTALARGSPGFTLAHCWAHVRRKFVEAEPNYPEESGRVLDLIRDLYAVERDAPQPGSDATGEERDAALALRASLRKERSAGIVAKIREWVYETKPLALPGSSLGKAIEYMMGLWPGLARFLMEARVPIDNNGAERAMRGPVVGRKNHYGSRSRRGTEAAALFYTLFETAKLRGVDPQAYVIDAARRAIRSPGTATLPRDLAS